LSTSGLKCAAQVADEAEERGAESGGFEAGRAMAFLVKMTERPQR
jgi:hypothetical protein